MAIGRINATLTGVQPGGLAKIVPTSVAVGSGSGSANSNGTVSFSSASSVSVNGVFSASYENYLILYNTTSASSAHTVLIRLRASGTDNSSSNYYFARNWVNYSGTAANSLINSNGLVTAWDSSYSGTNGTKQQIWIFSPFSITKTHLQWRGSNENTDYSVGAGDTSVTTSYDGFTIYPSTGNSTGSFSIYGYNQ